MKIVIEEPVRILTTSDGYQDFKKGDTADVPQRVGEFEIAARRATDPNGKKKEGDPAE